MSLYFAYKPNSTTEQSVSASVRNRGLSLLKAKPWDVSVTTVVVSNQPAYASYTKNLPYFMKATSEQRNTLITTAFPALPKFPRSIGWQLPPLIYDYSVKLRDRQIEALKTHSVPVTDGRSKFPTYVMREPTLASIKELMDMNPAPLLNTRHVLQTVNLDAMKVVLFLERLTSGFLLTHGYPAFRTIEDLNPTFTEDRTAPALKKRKVSTDRYFTCVQDPMKHTVDLTEDELKSLKADTEATISTIQLHTAKFTPNNSHVPWGPMCHLPNAEGLYFPYVKDLAVADSTTVPFVVQHYFMKCLGPNLVSASKSLTQLRSAWGLIKDTDLGHEMSHLYKCVHIALECQAAIYPVYTNSIYEGCVIWGSGFAVCIDDSVYKPVAYDRLQTLVQDTSMHSKAVNEIKGLLTIDLQEELDACRSIRGLSNIVRRSELDVIGREKVVEAAHRLCFPNKYWSSKQRYVKMALDMILRWSSPEDIDVDIPMHPSMMFSTKATEVVLSAFGHQAPSFMIPNGKHIELKEGTDPPMHLLVRMVGLKEAVLDMEYMLENAAITNNNSNLSAKHKDSAYNGVDKKEVWTKLLEIVKEYTQKPAAESESKVAAGNAGSGIEFDW